MIAISFTLAVFCTLRVQKQRKPDQSSHQSNSVHSLQLTSCSWTTYMYMHMYSVSAAYAYDLISFRKEIMYTIKGVGRHRQRGPWPPPGPKILSFWPLKRPKIGVEPPWKLKNGWGALPWSPREPSPGKIPAYALAVWWISKSRSVFNL